MVQQYSKANAKRLEVPSDEESVGAYFKRFEVPDEESVGENVEKFLGESFGCDATAAMKATDMWYKVLSMRVLNSKPCSLNHIYPGKILQHLKTNSICPKPQKAVKISKKRV